MKWFPPSLAQIEGALEAVAEVEAVVSEDVRLLEARSDAFAIETRPGEIWITGERVSERPNVGLSYWVAIQ